MPEQVQPPRLHSDAIGVARVLCILGVVYVHGWTGLTGEQLAAQAGSPQDLLRWVLMEGLGKSAVPLLGMISGYLVAGSRRTGDWRSHIGTKARTILLPMLLWNAIAILLVSGASRAGWIQGPIPHTVGWVLAELTALTRPQDINVQMPFLRDLFVCMILTLALVRTPTWALVSIALGIAALAVSGLPQPLLLRPIILFFFTTGMIVRRTGFAESAATFPYLLAILPLVLLLPVKVVLSLPPIRLWETHWHLMTALDIVTRLAAALFFWRSACAIAASRAAPLFLRAEAYAFFLFCCHVILVWLFGPLLGGISGPLGSPFYPVFLILQPFLCLVAAIAIGRLLCRISPITARTLSGGRLSPLPRA